MFSKVVYYPLKQEISTLIPTNSYCLDQECWTDATLRTLHPPATPQTTVETTPRILTLLLKMRYVMMMTLLHTMIIRAVHTFLINSSLGTVWSGFVENINSGSRWYFSSITIQFEITTLDMSSPSHIKQLDHDYFLTFYTPRRQCQLLIASVRYFSSVQTEGCYVWLATSLSFVAICWNVVVKSLQLSEHRLVWVNLTMETHSEETH